MRAAIHPHFNKIKAGELNCLSVKENGKPTYYLSRATLSDIRLRVQPAGVERAQREGVRNVHAWAVAFITGSSVDLPPFIPRSEFEAFGYQRAVYHFSVGRFLSEQTGEDITDKVFKRGYFEGKDLWVK